MGEKMRQHKTGINSATDLYCDHFLSPKLYAWSHAAAKLPWRWWRSVIGRLLVICVDYIACNIKGKNLNKPVNKVNLILGHLKKCRYFYNEENGHRYIWSGSVTTHCRDVTMGETYPEHMCQSWHPWDEHIDNLTKVYHSKELRRCWWWRFYRASGIQQLYPGPITTNLTTICKESTIASTHQNWNSICSCICFPTSPSKRYEWRHIPTPLQTYHGLDQMHLDRVDVLLRNLHDSCRLDVRGDVEGLWQVFVR